MYQTYYAHTLPDRPEGEWQGLVEHLERVAGRAAEHASWFDAEEWARIAGRWHDIGKYSHAFQSYLRSDSSADPHVAETTRSVDHATAGAQHAVASVHILGHLLAYSIAGHHSGLLDGRSANACLEARLNKSIEPWRSQAPDDVLQAPELQLPSFVRYDPFSVAFFVRMLFSCLVDADFLDTEDFMAPERAGRRPAWSSDVLRRIEEAVTRYVDALASDSTPVSIERGRVRESCLTAATMPQGLFSLTVPTGGGKTLSSLAFALRHARRHGLRRVVYVIPFTSIIEQTADVFRRAIGSLGGGIHDPVIEHHSNLDVGKETRASRLATENWDAPIVVTTSVQFYESLFAARTSRCRKLHNLAKSVIVLDEVQTLPVDLLQPCLRALEEIAGCYGASVVLCTATQPAIHRRDGFRIGLDGVREIVPDPKALYSRLKRVVVEDLGTLPDEQISHRIEQEAQVLCIVNTRQHARQLFESLGADRPGHFHLSALMCPQHRTEVLRRIRSELAAGRRCRVVATQLVEAGVDLDFPAVYRSLAGLDSIAQAAGRCNRNGLADQGRTFVFRSEHTASERFVLETAGCANQLLPRYEDVLSLEAVDHYFRLYYWEQSSRWDARQICKSFQLAPSDPEFPFLFDFASAAERFRLIEDEGRPVIIPWGHRGRELCERLRRSGGRPGRSLLRELQRYTVQVRDRQWREHLGRTIELVHDRHPVLAEPALHYAEQTGLDLDRCVAEALVT